MRKRLSDSFVERLKPGPIVIRVLDIEVKGFGLRVAPNGFKSYVFEFTRDMRKVQTTIHDLRRTFNTVCSELGYPPQVFDALLGHKVAGVAGVYTRLSPSGGILAEASQATADWVAAALEGLKPKLGERIARHTTLDTSESREASA